MTCIFSSQDNFTINLLYCEYILNISNHQKLKVQSPKWAYNSIDHFVLRQLEQHQLNPVADAKPLVLLRRVYFNLIGLPPTIKQQEKFLKSYQQNRILALQSLIDELLASSHFGEHWDVTG